LPDGSNAQDPIAYDACPPGPPDTVVYPNAADPACTTSGMCPVVAKGTPAVAIDGSWPSIYAGVIAPTCAVTGCHTGPTPKGGLDMSTEQAAYMHLLDGRVVPGHPETSKLYELVASGEMPKDGMKLSADTIQAIHDWIAQGAPEMPKE
jgi:hypothetical protein